MVIAAFSRSNRAICEVKFQFNGVPAPKHSQKFFSEGLTNSKLPPLCMFVRVCMLVCIHIQNVKISRGGEGSWTSPLMMPLTLTPPVCCSFHVLELLYMLPTGADKQAEMINKLRASPVKMEINFHYPCKGVLIKIKKSSIARLCWDHMAKPKPWNGVAIDRAMHWKISSVYPISARR